MRFNFDILKLSFLAPDFYQRFAIFSQLSQNFLISRQVFVLLQLHFYCQRKFSDFGHAFSERFTCLPFVSPVLHQFLPNLDMLSLNTLCSPFQSWFFQFHISKIIFKYPKKCIFWLLWEMAPKIWIKKTTLWEG